MKNFPRIAIQFLDFIANRCMDASFSPDHEGRTAIIGISSCKIFGMGEANSTTSFLAVLVGPIFLLNLKRWLAIYCFPLMRQESVEYRSGR